MPDPFDLVVRGATVVSPGRQEAADIGVRDGRIAQVGGGMTGREEIAADGLLALPGGVDAHVHLMYQALAEELRQAGEFDSPSRAGWMTSGLARWPRSAGASPRSGT